MSESGTAAQNSPQNSPLRECHLEKFREQWQEIDNPVKVRTDFKRKLAQNH
ncbi:hypothetical protein NIES2104_46880 [Leptolyngbya sp. NIES-2104]|nr:hypothetical protein NIES2104_46880 [Leptolyngbya sp. NIES-2104]